MWYKLNAENQLQRKLIYSQDHTFHKSKQKDCIYHLTIQIQMLCLLTEEPERDNNVKKTKQNKK